MKSNSLTTISVPLLISVMTCACLSSVPFDFGRQPLQFAPETLPHAQIDVPYEIEILVTQTETPVGAFDIADGALPKGLTLEKVNTAENLARISGTPTEAGTFAFTVSIWCYGTNVSAQTGSMDYVIFVGQ